MAKDGKDEKGGKGKKDDKEKEPEVKKSPEVLSYEGAPALPESFPFASAFAHSSFDTTETVLV